MDVLARETDMLKSLGFVSINNYFHRMYKVITKQYLIDKAEETKNTDKYKDYMVDCIKDVLMDFEEDITSIERIDVLDFDTVEDVEREIRVLCAGNEEDGVVKKVICVDEYTLVSLFPSYSSKLKPAMSYKKAKREQFKLFKRFGFVDIDEAIGNQNGGSMVYSGNKIGRWVLDKLGVK